MVQVRINVIDEDLNRLNNFYIENFGYDIHTQLINFISNELKSCEGYSTKKPEEQPRPTIMRKFRLGKNELEGYLLIIKYPDKSRTETAFETYDKALEYLNEWSKYSFSKDAREEVNKKLSRLKMKHIRRSDGKWAIVKCFGLTCHQFGKYGDHSDALIVRDFLIKHDWNLKYKAKNFPYDKNGTGAEKLLELAKKEMGE